MSVSMTFGDYTFDPVPQLTLNLEHVRDDVGNLLNVRYTANLAGKLVSLGKVNAGAAELLSQQTEMQIALNSCSGCSQFQFSCDGTELIDAYARIRSLEFSPSNDNWVFTANYTAQITWEASSDNILGASGNAPCLTCLSSVNEEWDIGQPESIYPYLLPGCSGSGYAQNKSIVEVSHTVSAKGYNCCISGVETQGWEAARDWVVDRLGFDSGILGDVSGVFTFNPSSFTAYNHRRQNTINKTTGDFSVVESWTLIGGSGFPSCLEDYTVDITNDIGTRFTQVSVQGNLQGLEVRDGSYSVTKTKFESALDCWEEVEPIIYSRANCLVDSPCPLNTTPTRKSITKNPSQGVINYAYTFSSQPRLVPNSLSESINISTVLASTQVAQIPIIGRRAGPILFDLRSNNPLRRDASINILMNEPTGCYSTGSPSGILCANLYQSPKTQVDALLCCLESDLNNNYDIVYLVDNNESWDPMNGQYTRNVSWMMGVCSGSEPANFC